MCPPFPPISMLTGVSAAVFANVGVFFETVCTRVRQARVNIEIGGCGGDHVPCSDDGRFFRKPRYYRPYDPSGSTTYHRQIAIHPHPLGPKRPRGRRLQQWMGLESALRRDRAILTTQICCFCLEQRELEGFLYSR